MTQQGVEFILKGKIAEVTRLIAFGALLTVANSLLSYGYHAYMSELYPTRMRARAVGFVYSFSRLSTVFSSLMIAFFLEQFGTVGVFTFIASAMLVVVLSVDILGPRTRGLLWRRLRNKMPGRKVSHRACYHRRHDSADARVRDRGCCSPWQTQ